MKSFVVFFLVLLFTSTQLQTQKSVFQKIEYASFDVNSYRTTKKDSVFVGLYCTINSNGLVTVYNPEDVNGPPYKYYSLQLSGYELEKIASVINSQKSLTSNLVEKKLKENQFYAGSYDYYRVVYSDGTIDSVCLIIPFVSKSFKEMDDLLDNVFYVRKNRTGVNPFNIPNDFLQSIKDCYLKSEYLPEIKSPPSFMRNN